VDTGFTLSHVVKLLQNREPARMETVALLDKPSRREVDIKATWTGFEIPDEFVVGYGIDFAQRNRNLPFIGKVRFTCLTGRSATGCHGCRADAVTR